MGDSVKINLYNHLRGIYSRHGNIYVTVSTNDFEIARGKVSRLISLLSDYICEKKVTYSKAYTEHIIIVVEDL